MSRLGVKLLSLSLLCTIFPISYTLPNLAQEITVIRERECPRDLSILADQLLRELPHYANRVIQRSRRLNRDIDTYYTVIVAGKPEFEPLELINFEYTPFGTEQPYQLFFTTLERSYQSDRLGETQNYHWLFLTVTSQGWQTVTMFSQIGTRDESLPPSPPWESSNSAIGQGVKLWLRDCNAR